MTLWLDHLSQDTVSTRSSIYAFVILNLVEMLLYFLHPGNSSLALVVIYSLPSMR